MSETSTGQVLAVQQVDLGSALDGDHTGGRNVTDGAMTAADTTLTSAAAAFAAGDVGRQVTVAGAGASGATLTTTIDTVTDASTVELATAATTTVSGAAVTIAGATVLLLEDCADFDEVDGGPCYIDGTSYTYAAVDDDASTITITPALAADTEDGTTVQLADPLTGAAMTDWIASVTLDGEDPGDTLEATVRSSLVDRLAGGIRGITGERVVLEWDDATAADDAARDRAADSEESGELWLVDILGIPQDGRGGVAKFHNTDIFAAVAGADLIKDLTYLPIDGSVHVYWRGIAQVPGADFTLSGQTLTLVDPGFKDADAVWVEYAYDNAGQPLLSGPAPGVTFQADGWRWVQIDRNDATSYSATDFNDSAWAVASAPFGYPLTGGGLGFPDPVTAWAKTTRMWARRTFTAEAGATMTGVIRADYYAGVWINGVSVFGQPVDGVEMTFTIDGSLVLDTNTVAVQVTDESFGDGCYFDLEIS